MGKKILKIGIISRDDYKKRTIAIARGEYKPRKDEPKVWGKMSLKSGLNPYSQWHRFSAARIKSCLES